MGLAMDPDPQDQPEGMSPFSKNGVFGTPAGSISSEPGFAALGDLAPYEPIGVIDAGDVSVVFSTNNTNSAIGIFNPLTGTYTDSINDFGQTWRLGFNLDYYITGQAQRNYKQELIVAFTDKRIPPMVVNVTTPGTIVSVEQLYLQPLAPVPTVVVSKETGGNLQTGAYYSVIALTKLDGTTTSWISLDGPVTVGGSDQATTQDAAVRVVITNIDDAYELVTVAIIFKNQSGVFVVYNLGDIAVSGNQAATVFNSNTQPTTTLTLEEVITPSIYYTKAFSMGLLQDSLYLINLESEPEPSLQPYVANAIVKWKSTPQGAGQTGIRTFMHEEVMSLFVRFVRNNGTKSRGYILFGPPPTVRDLQTNPDPDGLTGWQALNFRTDPQPATFDAVNGLGDMCHYANLNELYPDTPDFGSLRNQPVRHFRFPSIRWMQANLYPSSPGYGYRWLDKLEIVVDGITLPPGNFTGYELYYARRTPDNALVQGQCLMQFHGKLAGQVADTDLTFSGGNWQSHMFRRSGDPYLYPDFNQIRLHPFDMLFNRTATAGTFLSEQLRMKRTNIAYTGSYIEDGSLTGDKDAPVVLLMDYTAQPVTPSAPPSTDRLHRIVGSLRYLLNDTINGIWNNGGLETAVVGTLASDVSGISFSTMNIDDHEENFVEPWRIPTFEDMPLVNIISLRQDVYFPFTRQSLVYAGRVTGQGALTTGFGDAFISDYSFNTYGNWRPDLARWGGANGGTHVCRRFICQTVADLSQRYEIVGDDYSKFYPKSPLSPNIFSPTAWLTFLVDTKDPNHFGYSTTFNAINDLQTVTINTGRLQDTNIFPYRIHRTGKLSRQNKARSWRTLLPLDYYEMPKTFGVGIRVQGYADKLLINMERAFYSTVGNVSLEVANLSLALGSGDIFRIDPTEAVPDTTGVAGLQHDLAAVMTPAGYLFYDAQAAIAYRYDGELKQIANMIYRFLRSLPVITSRNTYRGDGIVMGYDPWYSRMLLTLRRKEVPENYVGEWTGVGMLDTLEVGDVVLRNGIYQQYNGLNESEDFQCEDCAVPALTEITDGPLDGTAGSTDVQDVMTFTATGVLYATVSSPWFLVAADPNVEDGWILRQRANAPLMTALDLIITLHNECGVDDFTVPYTNTPAPGSLREDTYEGNTEFDATSGTTVALIPVALGTGDTIELTGPAAASFAISTSGVVTTVGAISTLNALEELQIVIKDSGVNELDTAALIIHIAQDLVPIDTSLINVYTTARTIGTNLYQFNLEGGLELADDAGGLFELDGTIVRNTAVLTPGNAYELSFRLRTTTGLIATIPMLITTWFKRSEYYFASADGSCASTTRSYASVDVKKVSDDSLLESFTNVDPQEAVFQNETLPYYADETDSDGCSGSTTYYPSVYMAQNFTKDDCPDNSAPSVSEYAVAEGKYRADSQAAADALALGDILANGQTYANSQGYCTLFNGTIITT